MTPIVSSKLEEVEMPLYDTEDFKRIGQRVHLFAQPVGSTVMSIWRDPRIKDFWETNLVQPGMLESPYSMHVRDISVLLYDKDGPLPVFDRTGMGNLWAKSYLQFFILCKLYWQGPLSLLADPACVLGGMKGLVDMGPDLHAEETFKMLHYQLAHPLDCIIPCQANFSLTVTPYTPVCRQISVRVILNGRRLRPTL